MQQEVAPASSTPLDLSPRRLERPNFATMSLVESRPASAYGGSGTVGGVMVGAVLLGVINQGMSIYGLPDQWQYVVKGVVLLAAVIFDVVSNKKTGKA